MNKLVKGSIAGAAGIALLLGGAGTFALWNDSVGAVNASINTGNLDINTGTGTAAWTDASATTNGGVTTFDPATDKIVPGDVIKYTQPVSAIALGKNMKAKLAYTAGSIVIPVAVQPNVTVTLTTTTPAGGTITPTGTANEFFVTQTSATTPVTFDVIITVTFAQATAGQTNTNVTDAVKLTNAGFTLTQVRP